MAASWISRAAAGGEKYPSVRHRALGRLPGTRFAKFLWPFEAGVASPYEDTPGFNLEFVGSVEFLTQHETS
jgi:hypothetical protein